MTVQKTETKVKAGTVASALSGLAIWALSTYAFHGPVPEAVGAAVAVIVPALVTYLAGYLAKHTPREPVSE